MKITRFEDIDAWQEARKLVKMIYDVINKSSKFRKDFRLVNQIQDAAVSAMSNIAEGFARRSNREFIISIHSLSSTHKCKSTLHCLDQQYITQVTSRTFLIKLKLFPKLFWFHELLVLLRSNSITQ